MKTKGQLAVTRIKSVLRRMCSHKNATYLQWVTDIRTAKDLSKTWDALTNNAGSYIPPELCSEFSKRLSTVDWKTKMKIIKKNENTDNVRCLIKMIVKDHCNIECVHDLMDNVNNDMLTCIMSQISDMYKTGSISIKNARIIMYDYLERISKIKDDKYHIKRNCYLPHIIMDKLKTVKSDKLSILCSSDNAAYCSDRSHKMMKYAVKMGASMTDLCNTGGEFIYRKYIELFTPDVCKKGILQSKAWHGSIPNNMFSKDEIIEMIATHPYCYGCFKNVNRDMIIAAMVNMPAGGLSGVINYTRRHFPELITQLLETEPADILLDKRFNIN